MNFLLILAIILYFLVVIFLIGRYVLFLKGRIKFTKQPCLYEYVGPLLDQVAFIFVSIIKNISHYLFLLSLIFIRRLLSFSKYLIIKAEMFFLSFIEKVKKKKINNLE